MRGDPDLSGQATQLGILFLFNYGHEPGLSEGIKILQWLIKNSCTL